MIDKEKDTEAIRVDKIHMIDAASTDNPKLGAKVLADGRESLFLDYYLGFTTAVSGKTGRIYNRANRKREYLKLYVMQEPRTPIERQQNREIIELAKRIRFERAQQMLEAAEGYRIGKGRDVNYIDWMQSYIEQYTKKDITHVRAAYRSFVAFLNETPAYTLYATRIKPQQITKAMINAYVDYLQRRYNGETPHAVFARFKKMAKAAVEADVMTKNPTAGVIIKIDRGTIKKDVLSVEEVTQLVNTHYHEENAEVRRAFILSMYTGIRWCDIKELRFANVDFANRLLKFEQSKTAGRSAASGVVIPLNAGLLSLIGHPPADRTARLFNLPTYETCKRELSRWTAAAGIWKHITWHCARHSFAVNILNAGANIKTVASLLGHSGLSQTEKYTRAVDSLKEAAINSLPELKI